MPRKRGKKKNMQRNMAMQQARNISKQGNPNQKANPGKQAQFTDLTKVNDPIFKDQQEEAIFPTNSLPVKLQENLDKSKFGQPISTSTEQPNKPGKSNKGKPIHLENTGLPIPCSPSSSNQQHLWSIPRPGLGPKFKPLEDVEKPQLTPNITNSMQLPRPTGAELSMLQNTKSPVITLVGNQKKLNSAGQQKKILKFQMKMVAMQQEKERQVKAVQQTQSGTVNACTNANVGLPNSAETGPETENPIGMQTPMEVHNLEGAQHPSGIQDVMHPANLQEPVRSQISTGVTNISGIQNVTSVSHQPKNPTDVPPSNVYTIIKMPKQTGFIYPKGIPRSFLPQQQQPTIPQTGIPRSFLPQQQTNSQTGHSDGPIWPSYQINPLMAGQSPAHDTNANPLMVETDDHDDFPQPYSPSALYADFENSHVSDLEDADSDSPEPSPSGEKRLSAFQRLGPQTKKPKLTISLTVNEDQEVREVVDETEEVEGMTPVHLREDIMLSTDETVIKYLKSWPWKRNVIVKKSVTARNSKTVMMLEREQMEEVYNKETLFVQVTVKGYPPSWKKEQVLDTLMDNIRGYSFIPCFIEFNLEECKFLTLRCRSALLSLHKCGFIIRKNDVELTITIAQTELTLNQLDFVPRLVLRKRLNMCSDKESKLDLSGFTLKEDISHFIYFPLNRLMNQMEIIEMQDEITWNCLTDLNLSHNRIDSLDGFDLAQTTPKLRHLDLSYNCLEKITALLKIRQLPLNTIYLEGNPLCRNFIDSDLYVKALKMMFPRLTTIDGVTIRVKGEMPKFYRNYCPEDAKLVADKFLDIYFPLLDGDPEHRELLQDMYETTANMTITYSHKMSFSPIYRNFKTLFANSRKLEQGRMDVIKGPKAIASTIMNWPLLEHDPLTFTVDVIYHTDSITIIRVDGILKLTREKLAEDEHLLAFSRTVVLHTREGVEYKIQAETLHWSIPVGAYARSAFSVTTVKTKWYPKIDSTTDEKLQGELLKIFMKLTTMNKNISERCLEIKKWNLREALDHFTKLWKLDALESLMKETS